MTIDYLYLPFLLLAINYFGNLADKISYLAQEQNVLQYTQSTVCLDRQL
jgi:hypothetical protein